MIKLLKSRVRGSSVLGNRRYGVTIQTQKPTGRSILASYTFGKAEKDKREEYKNEKTGFKNIVKNQ